MCSCGYLLSHCTGRAAAGTRAESEPKGVETGLLVLDRIFHALFLRFYFKFVEFVDANMHCTTNFL